MSDEEGSASRAMRRALERCTVGPGCPCGAAYSAGSAEASSASRETSPAGGGSGSGDSSHHYSGESSHQSSGHSDEEDDSDDDVPQGYAIQDFDGLSTIRIGKCHCQEYCIVRMCWRGKDTARRFLGCRKQDVADRCAYIDWLDDPWPERVQQAFIKLWKELKLTRQIERCTKRQIVEWINMHEEAKKEKMLFQENADRAKRVAKSVCNNFHNQAVCAISSKTNLMVVVYCLVGGICFLTALIFVILKH